MTYGEKSTENRRKKHIRPGNDPRIGKLGLADQHRIRYKSAEAFQFQPGYSLAIHAFPPRRINLYSAVSSCLGCSTKRAVDASRKTKRRLVATVSSTVKVELVDQQRTDAFMLLSQVIEEAIGTRSKYVDERIWRLVL